MRKVACEALIYTSRFELSTNRRSCSALGPVCHVRESKKEAECHSELDAGEDRPGCDKGLLATKGIRQSSQILQDLFLWLRISAGPTYVADASRLVVRLQ
mmetsp:Transcript_54263/g.104895  ORF Transcript_54263/g.104895 Transcript_54263/m.104895 type:complete len:100 (-) Transcript_54263:563-862(-)